MPRCNFERRFSFPRAITDIKSWSRGRYRALRLRSKVLTEMEVRDTCQGLHQRKETTGGGGSLWIPSRIFRFPGF